MKAEWRPTPQRRRSSPALPRLRRSARPVGQGRAPLRAGRLAATRRPVTAESAAADAPVDTPQTAPADAAPAPSRAGRIRLPSRIRRLGRGRLPGQRTMKVALAAVAAYLVADLLPSDEPPVVAALTALLVVQLTLYQTVRSGWQRIGAVLAGALLAVVLSTAFGLTWWSFALTVLAALAVGQWLRLGDHAVEVPITAMLLLVVGSQARVGLDRLYETLVGAAVGVLISLLTAPVYVQPAADAVGRLAEGIGGLLRSLAQGLQSAWTYDWAVDRLQRARELEHSIRQARAALARAEESLRLNPRGRHTTHIPGTLRPRLTALEYAAINLRVVCRSLADRVAGLATNDLPGPQVRIPLARLLDAAADAVAEFGGLAAADATAAEGPMDRDDDRLRGALDRARAERDAAGRAMLVDPIAQPEIWRVHGALLAHVDRVLAEIDPDTGVAAQAISSARSATPPGGARLRRSRLHRLSRSKLAHPIRSVRAVRAR